VLNVIGSLGAGQGGLSRAVPSQCIAMARTGFTVGIASLQGHEKPSQEAEQMASNGVKELPCSPWSAPWGLWQAVRRYDIVHVHGLWVLFNHLACLFARIQRKPLVVSPHGMLDPWALSQKKLKKDAAFLLYQWKDLRKASVLQATAGMEAGYFRDMGLGGALAVIANGVSIPMFKKKAARQKDGRRRLLFLSRVHPKKGVLELVRAVASLRAILENGKWIVTIAGPDEDGFLAEIKREARRLGVDFLMEYTGAVENEAKWDLYRSSDLFVLPTYSENFGLVVAEALGCGVPVITTQGAPWEDLLTRNCGWWYKMGQTELEETLRDALLAPPSTLAQMGERGRSLVNEKYNWDSVGSELGRLYLWLLGRGERPSCLQGP
jgi:glycosyltransferase involved in cell wall biosynthesis